MSLIATMIESSCFPDYIFGYSHMDIEDTETGDMIHGVEITHTAVETCADGGLTEKATVYYIGSKDNVEYVAVRTFDSPFCKDGHWFLKENTAMQDVLTFSNDFPAKPTTFPGEFL